MSSSCLQYPNIESTPPRTDDQIIGSCNNFATNKALSATQVRNMCSGRGISGKAWYDFWSQNKCSQIFNCSLTTLNGQSGIPNAEQLKYLREDFENIFYTYLTTPNIKISEPSSSNYNPFQEEIRNACFNTPGACDSFLSSSCQSCTRDDIASNSALLDFCGCFAPPLDPKYGISKQKGNIQCDPLCTPSLTIKLINQTDYTQLQCTEDVCVIDDITIKATKTSGGSINFKQVCSQCNENTCRCIFSDITTNFKDVNFQGENFSQVCGSNSFCYQKNESGVETPINCEDAIKKITSNNITPFPISNNVIYFILVIIVLAILLALASKFI